MGLFTHSYETEEELWRSVLTGQKPAPPMGQVRKIFSLFSSNGRCKACNIPFTGKSSRFFNLWSHRSNLSPRFCKKYEDFAKEHIGGTDV